MSQIKTYQHFVFKLHTQRLKKAGWSLSLTLADARRNGRCWRCRQHAAAFHAGTPRRGKSGGTHLYAENKAARAPAVPILSRRPTGIQQAYDRLDQLQFQPDYLCLVMDSIADYHRANKVFTAMGFHLCGCLAQTGV